jgi:hypothetical protein
MDIRKALTLRDVPIHGYPGIYPTALSIADPDH